MNLFNTWPERQARLGRWALLLGWLALIAPRPANVMRFSRHVVPKVGGGAYLFAYAHSMWG